MTFQEGLREVSISKSSISTTSKALMSVFDMRELSKNQIPERREEIELLCDLLERRLIHAKLDDQEKAKLMTIIEKLKLASEILHLRQDPKYAREVQAVGRHLAKKMQSAHSG